MNKRKLLEKLKNSQKNVRFGDFVILIEAFEFRQIRSQSSHNIYAHPGIPEIVNIQNYKGQVKPYQVKQFLSLVETYNLRLESE